MSDRPEGTLRHRTEYSSSKGQSPSKRFNVNCASACRRHERRRIADHCAAARI